MKSLSEIIIDVYLTVCKELKYLLKDRLLRERGKRPKLTDEECLTIFIVAEAIGINTETGIWNYFKEHWNHYFPSLPSRSHLHRQISNLWRVSQLLHKQILQKYLPPIQRVVIDAFPMRVCRYSRSKRVSRFKECADYDYCASQQEKYFGLRGNLVISDTGFIINCLVASPTFREREASFEALQDFQGYCIGDKGYVGDFFWEQMKQEGIHFRTPFRKNMDAVPEREATKKRTKNTTNG